jgi:hypothetical protein
MLSESLTLGTGALYKMSSIDNNQSEQILSPIITLGKKWADHTRTLFFSWPLLIPNYFPLHLSLSFLERNWQSRFSLSWRFREEISLSVEERIRLCPLLSLALAASGPPTCFKIGIAFYLRKNRLEMGVQNHPHWGTIGVIELSRDLSLHYEKKPLST